MPRCQSCGRDKALKQYDDTDPFKRVSDLTAPPTSDRERNERFGQGDYLYCATTACPSAVFVCFSCQDNLHAKVRCEAHDTCESCRGANSVANYCPRCWGVYRSCGSRGHATSRCPVCNVPTKSADELRQALTSAETPISLPVPLPAFVPCSASASGDFSVAAVQFAGMLADWLQNNGNRFGVEVGHLTLCVTILEEIGGEADAKLKFLLTHSDQYTYQGVYDKKQTVRAKVGGGKADRYALAGGEDSGMRRLMRAFMEENKAGISVFLARYGRRNVRNSIMLPETNPMIFYDRERYHYMLVPDAEGVVDAQIAFAATNGLASLRSAAQFAKSHGYRVMTDDKGNMGSYHLEANNLHHAEMRAVTYANRYNYRVVAMAPTKGCCTHEQRSNNCNAALTRAGLIERIPAPRRTQGGYNEFLKSGASPAPPKVETKQAEAAADFDIPNLDEYLRAERVPPQLQEACAQGKLRDGQVIQVQVGANRATFRVRVEGYKVEPTSSNPLGSAVVGLQVILRGG